MLLVTTLKSTFPYMIDQTRKLSSAMFDSVRTSLSTNIHTMDGLLLNPVMARKTTSPERYTYESISTRRIRSTMDRRTLRYSSSSERVLLVRCSRFEREIHVVYTP